MAFRHCVDQIIIPSWHGGLAWISVIKATVNHPYPWPNDIVLLSSKEL